MKVRELEHARGNSGAIISSIRSKSIVHCFHPAARILGALALLISISTLHGDMTNRGVELTCVLYLAILGAAAAVAGLDTRAVLRGAATVLPFALCFAVITMLAGDAPLAFWLLVRSYLSALTAVLLLATTPAPDLIAGLEWLKAPRFLLHVMQFLYRYLSVLRGEALAMRVAGLSRGGSVGTLQLRHAAAMVGVLFARSYRRADAIHRAMLSRGFSGRLPLLRDTPGRAPFRLKDAGFVATATLVAVTLRAV